jgi:hypothetical protein
VSASRQSRSPLSPRAAAGLSVLAVPAALPVSVVAAEGPLAAVRASVLRGRGCGAPRPAAPPRRVVVVGTRVPCTVGARPGVRARRGSAN